MDTGMMRHWRALAFAGMCSLGVAAAQEAPTLEQALTGGKPSLDLRLRVEHVDNDSAVQTRTSTATTLRTRLGYLTGAWQGFDALVEYEGVVAEDATAYNTTLNGQATRPVIADPKGSELNQAFLRYAGIPGLTLQAGRQRFVLDNHRWVGNVGWRQNEQTYDGAVLDARPLPGVALVYGYLHNVDSIFFTDFPLRAHLANLSYAPGPALKASAYAYALDFDAANAGNRQDSLTIGARLAGSPAVGADLQVLYAAEYARQGEHGEAGADTDADYLLAELGAALGKAQLKAGYEVLGSNDGLYAVQTPLATLHAHNGWADLFLTTPAAGLRDAYLSASAPLGPVTLAAAAHRFTADDGGADYGDEIDASIGYAFTPRLAALAKVARYRAQDSAAMTFAGNVDTDKGWLQLEYKF